MSGDIRTQWSLHNNVYDYNHYPYYPNRFLKHILAFITCKEDKFEVTISCESPQAKILPDRLPTPIQKTYYSLKNAKNFVEDFYKNTHDPLPEEGF